MHMKKYIAIILLGLSAVQADPKDLIDTASVIELQYIESACLTINDFLIELVNKGYDIRIALQMAREAIQQGHAPFNDEEKRDCYKEILTELDHQINDELIRSGYDFADVDAMETDEN